MQTGAGAKAQLTAKGKGKAEAESGADATAKADADPLIVVFNRPQRDVRVALTKPYYSKPGKPSTLNALQYNPNIPENPEP